MTGFVVAVLVRFGSLSRLGLGAVVAALVAGSASVASGSAVGLGCREYSYGYDAAPYDYGDPANDASPVVGADILSDALGSGSDASSLLSAGRGPGRVYGSSHSRVAPRQTNRLGPNNLEIRPDPNPPANPPSIPAGLVGAQRTAFRNADSIYRSSDFGAIRNAHTSGVATEVRIGGTTVIYEPGMPASGMTLFGKDAFVLGPQAFESERELAQTLLHESHRLATSARSGSALVTSETQSAFDFAAQNYQTLLGG